MSPESQIAADLKNKPWNKGLYPIFLFLSYSQFSLLVVLTGACTGIFSYTFFLVAIIFDIIIFLARRAWAGDLHAKIAQAALSYEEQKFAPKIKGTIKFRQSLWHAIMIFAFPIILTLFENGFIKLGQNILLSLIFFPLAANSFLARISPPLHLTGFLEIANAVVRRSAVWVGRNSPGVIKSQNRYISIYLFYSTALVGFSVLTEIFIENFYPGSEQFFLSIIAMYIFLAFLHIYISLIPDLIVSDFMLHHTNAI